jgi:hypothetical protein
VRSQAQRLPDALLRDEAQERRLLRELSAQHAIGYGGLLRSPSRKELNSLLGGLAYDAAVAVAGVALSKVPLPPGGSDFTAVPFRCSGVQQDQAVRQEAPILFSRFSLISMVSRFEVHAYCLLLQRRVIDPSP